MTKNLGFWNRLAIVLTALSVLIAPLAIQLSIAEDITATKEAHYAACKVVAEGYPDFNSQMAHKAECTDNFINDNSVERVWTWANWREFALGTLIFCAVVYALLFVGTQTVKWIWRGKKV